MVGLVTAASLVLPPVGAAMPEPSGETEIAMLPTGTDVRPSTCCTAVTLVVLSLSLPSCPCTPIVKPVVVT